MSVNNQNTTASNYRNTNTSNYDATVRNTNNYVVPSYVSSGKGYGNSIVQGQSHISAQGQPNTTTINSSTYHTPNYVNAQPQTSANQPAPSFRKTYSSQVEQTKGSPIAGICFGLLGVIALASLVLGILFAVGVIGNKGTDIDPTVSTTTNVQNAHLSSLHSHILLATHHNHLTAQAIATDPVPTPSTGVSNEEDEQNESENEESDEPSSEQSETISEQSEE